MSRLVVCEDTDHGKFTRCLWGHRHRAIVSEVCVLTDLLLANYYGLHCLNLMTLPYTLPMGGNRTNPSFF